MLPAVLLAAIPLLGATANGLECKLDHRCMSGVCLSSEPAAMRVVFVRTPNPAKPTVFVLGNERLMQGMEISEREIPAMSSVFGSFEFKPRTYAYAVGRIESYDPATGSVEVAVGGNSLSVAADGQAEVTSLRQGRPGISWLTRYTGTCTTRNF
ncbi:MULTISPECIES: hypothetical protein [unclassified Haematobacter]|uniref:hypothetical protein n=1 Tax=unclassified Haematobacter TaxID=2640585 RepID=UPI0025C28FC0|nr:MULTISPECIES: hypothetical protein [unclassified Haematobacter]